MRTQGAFAAALAGNAGRGAFVPYLLNLAAGRAGRPLDQLLCVTTELVAALTAARQLVECDAIHVPVDRVGSPAFQALERLVAMSHDCDVAAIIPGPVELGAANDTDNRDDMTDAFEDLARAVLEARCDVLIVKEPDPDPATADSFRAVAKLAAFFGARTLVLGPPEAEFAVSEGFDAVDAGAAGPITAGVPVTLASPDMATPAGGIVSSSWSAPPRAADAEWLRRVARRIRGDRKE